MSSSFVFFFLFKFQPIVRLASQLEINWILFNPVNTESFLFLKKKKKKDHNAHIAQLNCTLVCLEPTALFWDNIRGFKAEHRTSCLANVRQFNLVTTAVFFGFFFSFHMHAFVSFLLHQCFHAGCSFFSFSACFSASKLLKKIIVGLCRKV